MKLSLIIQLISLLILSSFDRCTTRPSVYDHTAEIKELGNGYYFLGDGEESQILLNLKPEEKSKFGKTIIPAEVVQYNFDDNFIVAQSLDHDTGKEIYRYWIVEKSDTTPKPTILLDSVSFNQYLDSLRLNVKLKQR